MIRSRSVWVGWLGCSAAMCAGCNAVLGIDEAEVDPRLSSGKADVFDGGTPDATPQRDTTPDPVRMDARRGDAASHADADEGAPYEEPTLCDSYCETVVERCTDANEQYLDRQQCLEVCALLPEGVLGETQGNTVACRMKYAGDARYARGTELSSYCRRAGPGGDGVCGSDCASYCRLMMQTCTDEVAGIYRFDDEETCMEACKALPLSEVSYSTGSAEVYDGNHVQCRLFHVTSAAMLDAEEHCEHAMGVTLCEGERIQSR